MDCTTQAQNDAPILSVIMAVYNVEKYVANAIQSVLDQTLTDFELILIDDGSIDESGKLCDCFALKDSRIRVIHKKNCGLSSARNCGIQVARGRYLGFVDSDDWIEPDFYDLLYRMSLECDAQIAACGFIKIDAYTEIMFQSPLQEIYCMTSEEALNHMFHTASMRYSSCNKLFEKGLFKDLEYPTGSILEDKAVIYKLIHRANRIAWCPAPKYHYFMRPDSIMHALLPSQYQNLFDVNDEMMCFIEIHYPKLKGIAGVSYALECLKLIEMLKSISKGPDPDPILSPAEIADIRIKVKRCIHNTWDHWSSSQLDLKTKWQLLCTLLTT